MTRNVNYLLLIAIIFALFLSACDTPPDDFNIVPTYTVAPVVEDTSIPLKLDTPALGMTDTPVPVAEDTVAPPTANTSWPTIFPSTANFNYYVLALSWAPDYCSANPSDSQECSLGKKYAFVLHGLWPQYTKGYPSNCGSEPLPKAVKARFPHLYPSDKLFDHEWSKHGTCSGLSPADYLTVASQLKDRVQIPATYRAPDSPFHTTADDLKQAFLQANPALIGAGLATNCSGSGRYLTELYVCVSKDGQPAACGADVLKSALKSCSRTDFIVRNVR